MKKIIKYVLIFITTVSILFFLLVLTAKIPKKAIEKNIKDSILFYEKHTGIDRIKIGYFDTYIHYYADTRKLNILYNIDSKHPIKSILWAEYYQKVNIDSNNDFIDMLTNDRKTNTNYLRYWNGCLLFLRPLLIVFNMENIYLINKILLIILFIVLFIMLFLRSKKTAIIYLLSLIITSSWYVSYCIEYSVMFYVMFITSIIALIIDKKGSSNQDSKLFVLFFITGIITTFFDFLTTEILTIFVPLLFIILIRKEEGRLGNLKSLIIFCLKACILWFVGYGLMWVAKWVLSSIILNINSFDYVKRNLTMRFNGLQGVRDHSTLYKNVIPRNIFSIGIMNYIKRNFYNWKVKYAVVVFISLVLVFTNWKKMKNKKYLLILFVIALVPYARYLILANHSYRHIMFTFRDQIITLIVLIYTFVDCFNKELLNKKVTINFNKK